MSFRELRNFCEMMRGLGYPRIISMENFRIPNFKLVAEIIFWLVKRFDPKADIPDVIEEERDRVEFIRAACQFFYQNLKIKLNLKKLYSSDGYCVQELIKVAEILFKAKNSINSKEDFEFSNELDITSRKTEITQIKSLSTEIVETGLNLLDLLEKEKILKESREKAIEFLENISKNSDSNKEAEQIEKRIISILQNQQSTLEQLDDHISNLKSKSGELEEEIKKKQIELERAEKRLESLNMAKPAHFNEMRQLEAELSHVYRVYVEKIRNGDFLSNQLEMYHRIEEERNKNINKEIKAIQENIRKINERNINVENDDFDADDNNEDYYENYQQDAINKNNFRNGTLNKNFADNQGELDGAEDLGEEAEEEDVEDSDNNSNF